MTTRIVELEEDPGTVDYAIGDVHGYLGHMEAALRWCADDAASAGLSGRVHLLGDYVDRGSDSKTVIETLMAGPTDDWMTWHPVRGNHDQVFSASWRDPSDGHAYDWWSHGGQQTLASYGWNPLVHGLPGTLAEWVPEEHILFLEALPLANVVGNRLFVHAGIRPGRPLDEQIDRDLMWIRNDFLKSRADFGHVVVHGHSPEEENPFDHGNRIAMDSGCFFSDAMAVAAFDYGSPKPRFRKFTSADVTPVEERSEYPSAPVVWGPTPRR